MVRERKSRFAALTAALAIFSTQPAMSSPPAAPEIISGADATISAPSDWREASGPGGQFLTAPEGDAELRILRGVRGATPADVVRAALASEPGGAPWPIRLTTVLPARNGWDDVVLVDFDLPPAEHRSAQARLFRKDQRWTVLLVSGNGATLEKRMAAVNLVIASLRPAGYVPESFAGRAAHRMDPGRVRALLEFTTAAARELGIPGIGLALIDHGDVIYEGGIGVRRIGGSAFVDAHTRFMIASNTKGMTTLLLARLVSEGRIRWDEPVADILPSFQLGDPDTTKHVLVRHLVCACTGLPRKDFQWLLNSRPGDSAQSTFAQLARTQPTTGFGQVYQYNNLLAAAAGYVAGHVLYPRLKFGAAYDRAMQREIFEPLGMTETGFEMPAPRTANVASPHGFSVDGETEIRSMAPASSIRPFRPAGGAWSTAHDMIKYVGNELAEGVLPGGRALLDRQDLLARRARGVQVSQDIWYGLGLREDATSGVSVFRHGGSLEGYKSDVYIIPSAGVGAVLLTNADTGQLLLEPFKRRLLELLFDGRPEASEDLKAAADQWRAQLLALRAQLELPPPGAQSALLADRYENADLGRIIVRRDAGRVIFDFGSWSSPVASRRNRDGTTSFIPVDVTIAPTYYLFDFVAGTQDGKRVLTLRDGQHIYRYVEADRASR